MKRVRVTKLKTFLRWCKENVIRHALPIKYTFFNDKLYTKLMTFQNFQGITEGLHIPVAPIYWAGDARKVPYREL